MALCLKFAASPRQAGYIDDTSPPPAATSKIMPVIARLTPAAQAAPSPRSGQVAPSGESPAASAATVKPAIGRRLEAALPEGVLPKDARFHGRAGTRLTAPDYSSAGPDR